MTGHTAHLRVYEPLAAFPEAERRVWTAYAAGGRATGRTAAARIEERAVLRGLAGRPPGLPEEPGEAFVAEVDGVVLVCPWRTRVRAAQALVEWRGTLHEDLADAFVPRAVAQAAVDELEQWQQDHPDLRTAVRTSTWTVPVGWFVLVEPGERSVSLGAPDGRPVPRGEPGDRPRPRDVGVPAGVPAGRLRTGRELVYRTAMSRARRRVARALAVLRRTVDDGGDTVSGLEDLGRWLEEFHPRSLVELDYGGLVHLLDDDALLTDESARDVADALAALDDGAPDRAAAAYGRVTGRMKALQAVECAN